MSIVYVYMLRLLLLCTVSVVFPMFSKSFPMGSTLWYFLWRLQYLLWVTNSRISFLH